MRVKFAHHIVQSMVHVERLTICGDDFQRLGINVDIDDVTDWQGNELVALGQEEIASVLVAR